VLATVRLTVDNGPSPTAVICLSPGTGGMEHDAIKLADLLSECCEVVLICKKNSFIEDRCNEGDHIFVCRPVAFTNKSFSVSMLVATAKLLKKYAIRNVVYFGASELKTLYFSFRGKDLNVIVRHGTTKSRAKKGRFHRLVYSCVSYHVAISRHLLENVRGILPRSRTTLFRVIYPSFSFRQMPTEPHSTARPIRIVHLGRVARGKGHKDAMLACRVLYERAIDFELRFFGDCNDRRYLKDLKDVTGKLPYGDRVKFLGYVRDVGRCLDDADIFLYPSYGEGFGNVFVEAMGHGLSTVTYENTTFPEFREIGFKFRMAKSKDVSALSHALLEAVTNIENDKIHSGENAALAANIFNKERELVEWRSILV